MTKSKHAAIYRRGRGNSRKYLKTALIIVLSCVLVWGFFLFLSQLGPQKVNVQSSENSGSSVKAVGLFDDKYTAMTAEELKVWSADFEKEARSLMDAGDYEAASLKYKQAFKLQGIINRKHSQSSQNDFSREIHLKLEAKNAAAEPLFLKSLDWELQADDLVEAGNVDLAAEALDQAIAIQHQLNHEYRDARQVSPSRLRQLERKLAELKSDKLHSKIERASERAALLKEDGAWESAGELFEQAALLQAQLNADFPNSPYASLLRVTELQGQGQMAQSTIFAQNIAEASGRLDQLLATQNDHEAMQLLEELKQSLRTFEKTYPLSTSIDEALKSKITYLYTKREDLEVIQSQVYKSLIPIPGIETVQMFRTEVYQSLYVLVMDLNPSRNPAALNPVDSVNWTDAAAFCERLAWVLGKGVRLPSEEEFRKALGDFASEDIDNLAWSVVDSHGFSQPVGQKKSASIGFYDLLGNVSEWLVSETSDADTAYHIGGHMQDSPEVIHGVPVRKLRKSERSRMTGFRFVVLD